MRVKINRKDKYEWHLAYGSGCQEWKWKIQHFIDCTWNKFIYWNPLLKDVIILDNSDTWSVDYTLSKLAVPMIKQLHREKMGYGYIDDSDVPDELKTGTKEHDEIKYNWFMNEIIWCLNEIAQEEPNSPDIELDEDLFVLNRDERSPEQNETMKNFLKLHEEYDARIANGCRLFGKYFRNLWS